LPKDLINQSSFAIQMGTLCTTEWEFECRTLLNYPQPILLLLLPFFVSNPYLSGNRYATNYCCRYWNFYFGGKLLANLGMENIVFLVLTQSISTY
jgi:hypothetical protein